MKIKLFLVAGVLVTSGILGDLHIYGEEAGYSEKHPSGIPQSDIHAKDTKPAEPTRQVAGVYDEAGKFIVGYVAGKVMDKAVESGQKALSQREERIRKENAPKIEQMKSGFLHHDREQYRDHMVSNGEWAKLSPDRQNELLDSRFGKEMPETTGPEKSAASIRKEQSKSVAPKPSARGKSNSPESNGPHGREVFEHIINGPAHDGTDSRNEGSENSNKA